MADERQSTFVQYPAWTSFVADVRAKQKDGYELMGWRQDNFQTTTWYAEYRK